MPELAVWLILFLPLTSFVFISLVVRPFFNSQARLAGTLSILAVAASLLLSVWALSSTISNNGEFAYAEHAWLKAGEFNFSISILLDPLTAIMVFVVSAVTTENQGGLGKAYFERMSRGSVLVLIGRAAVVNFDEMLDAAESGHIRVAADVFPDEPLPQDHRARHTPNVLLSAHRAGGPQEGYTEIGEMVVDDLELVARGLPPQRMQRALLEVVQKYRSKPVDKS